MRLSVGPIRPEVDLPQTIATRIHASLEHRSPPFLIAICGWADTGKSTLAAKVCLSLGRLGISGETISTDDFMRDRVERNALGISGYDSRSINIESLQGALTSFLRQEPFDVHPYDNRTGTKSQQPKTVMPADVLVVEGIHSLHGSVTQHMNLKIFITSDQTTLRQMRYRANLIKRGMAPDNAAARISSEWEDYSVAVRPRVEVADLVVQVDSEFRYHCLQNDAAHDNPAAAPCAVTIGSASH